MLQLANAFGRLSEMKLSPEFRQMRLSEPVGAQC